MPNLMTINSLAKYYIDRYKIKDYDEMDGEESADVKAQLLNTFSQAIRRIAKSTPYRGESFYTHMKFGNKYRSAELGDFEKYCFTKLAAYIKKCYDYCSKSGECAYDKKKLAKDIKKNERLYYWENQAEEIGKRNDAYFEAMDQEEEPDSESRNSQPPLPEDVTGKMLEMMVIAIYNRFYDGFNYDKLEEDMGLKKAMEERVNMRGVYPLPDEVKAENDLSDYHNYIGKPRSIKTPSPSTTK